MSQPSVVDTLEPRYFSPLGLDPIPDTCDVYTLKYLLDQAYENARMWLLMSMRDKSDSNIHMAKQWELRLQYVQSCIQVQMLRSLEYATIR